MPKDTHAQDTHAQRREREGAFARAQEIQSMLKSLQNGPADAPSPTLALILVLGGGWGAKQNSHTRLLV